MKTASWIIVNRATGAAIFETFNENTAKAINEKLYRAIPALEYMRSFGKHNLIQLHHIDHGVIASIVH